MENMKRILYIFMLTSLNCLAQDFSKDSIDYYSIVFSQMEMQKARFADSNIEMNYLEQMSAQDLLLDDNRIAVYESILSSINENYDSIFNYFNIKPEFESKSLYLFVDASSDEYSRWQNGNLSSGFQGIDSLIENKHIKATVIDFEDEFLSNKNPKRLFNKKIFDDDDLSQIKALKLEPKFSVNARRLETEFLVAMLQDSFPYLKSFTESRVYNEHDESGVTIQYYSPDSMILIFYTGFDFGVDVCQSNCASDRFWVFRYFQGNTELIMKSNYHDNYVFWVNIGDYPEKIPAEVNEKIKGFESDLIIIDEQDGTINVRTKLYNSLVEVQRIDELLKNKGLNFTRINCLKNAEETSIYNALYPWE
jgi:hypothetical protein